MRAVLLAPLGLLASSALASPITTTFTGTVNFAGPALSPVIVVGDPITGSYTFDSNTPNTSLTPLNTGDYAVTLFTATIGSFTFNSTTATLFVEVGSGEYLVSGLGTPADTVNGHTLDTFGVRTTSAQVTTTALPLTPPNGVYTYEMDFGLPSREGDVGGALSIPVVVPAVPEPGTAFLLGLGLLGLIGAVAQKRMTNPGTSQPTLGN
jgi:hypothetical protein